MKTARIAIRSVAEQRCAEYQVDAAWWAAEAACRVERGLDARDAQAAASICHDAMCGWLDRLNEGKNR